jgi:hypothetical protein
MIFAGALRLVRSLGAVCAFGAFCTFAFCTFAFCTFIQAQTGPCDPQLIQPQTNPYGYRQRGDRCEGIYVQQVGGSPLTVASWTESFEDYDLASGRPLTVEWDAPEGAVISLRAEALRHRLYFRMDAARPPGSKSYSWNVDLLAAIGVARPELGMLGSTRFPGANTERRIYLPLRIGQKNKPVRTGAYKLVVVPGAEAKEIYLTVALDDGRGRKPLKDGDPLGYGYYPAERAVEIPISGLPAPGIYRVEVGATLRNGMVSTAQFWFYHPRR